MEKYWWTSDMVMIVSHSTHDDHKLESCHSHEDKQSRDLFYDIQLRSMTFWETFIFQDFSMTFHDSNIFQDFPWSWEPCISNKQWSNVGRVTHHALNKWYFEYIITLYDIIPAIRDLAGVGLGLWVDLTSLQLHYLGQANRRNGKENL